MSQLAHTQPQVLRFRLPLRVWLAAAALIAGAAIALFFAISGGDEATQTPKTAVPNTATGVRYDGGPEEGTRGVVPARQPGVRYDGGPEEGTAAITQRSAPATFDPNSIKSPPGVRYDGGPEEGTADLSPSQPRVTQSRAFPGLASEANGALVDGRRYDGGPEEGTRGALSSDAVAGTRYDGGPEEGSRGTGH
jgi:hypothetical protein